MLAPLLNRTCGTAAKVTQSLLRTTNPTTSCNWSFAQHGDAKLTDLLATLADCAKGALTRVYDRCKAGGAPLRQGLNAQRGRASDYEAARADVLTVDGRSHET